MLYSVHRIRVQEAKSDMEEKTESLGKSLSSLERNILNVPRHILKFDRGSENGTIHAVRDNTVLQGNA